MWLLILLLGFLVWGLPAGIVVSVVDLLVTARTGKVNWRRTIMLWVAGMVVVGFISDGYHVNAECLWHFVGVLFGSGVVVCLALELIQGRLQHPNNIPM